MYATNALSGLAFVALVALGIMLARRVARSDDRGAILLWAVVIAGLLGAVGQIVLLGAVKVSIDLPYCDCGFKNEEIVSQMWAEMVVQGASQLLVAVAGLLAAVGIVASGIVFGGRAMPSGWTALSGVVAVAVVVVAVLQFVGLDNLYDLTQWLSALLTGILVPAWRSGSRPSLTSARLYPRALPRTRARRSIGGASSCEPAQHCRPEVGPEIRSAVDSREAPATGGK